jgi:hypothetical protein
MNHGVLERYVKDVRAMWPDLSRKGDPEKARQSLIDLVQTEIDRIWAIAAEHEQKAGDEPARERARRAFVISPEAEAMRRSFLRSKGSLERGIAAYRKEKRARKADSDTQDTGQVPGRNVSPYDYDGRPASWWNEQVGGVARRHREGGDIRSGGRQGQETGRERDQIGEPDEGDCGNDGRLAAGSSGAAVEICYEDQADGTRRVPATSEQRDRGWESVVVEESDVLACQGFLPERCTGIAGDIEPADALTDEMRNREAETSRLDQAGECEASLNAGCAAPVTQEAREEAVDPGPAEEFAEVSGASQTSEKAPNEANFRDDVCIAQHEDAIDVPTNSAGFLGLDNLQTKPSMRGRLSSEAVQILWSGVPAHPLRRRLQSIWLSSDLATDVRFVQPATHPLSLRLREIALPRYRQYSSVDRRNVIRSTIYSGSTVGSVVAIKPESKGRHHSISRQPAKKPLSGFVSGSSAGRHAHRAFARQVARFLTDSAFG